MSELDEKLNAILGNPQMMQNILNMAQQMGNAPSQQSQDCSSSGGQNPEDMIRQLVSLSRQAGLDAHQQELLHALSPYLGQEHLHRLERAMYAAKLADFAADALNGRR